jgi:hypothetical protein
MIRPIRVACLSVLLLLPACDKQAASDADKAAPEKTEAPAQPEAPPPPPVEPYTTPGTPALPAPIAKLEFGMTREQAKQAYAELADDGKLTIGDASYQLRWSAVDDTLVAVAFTFPRPEGIERATKAWGEYARVDEGGEGMWWVDADKRMRGHAEVEDDKVVISLSTYMPIAELLGAEGEAFAFEQSTPLIGSTIEQIAAAYPDHYRHQTKEQVEAGQKILLEFSLTEESQLPPAAERHILVYRPSEFAPDKMWIELATDKRQKVTGYRIHFGWYDVFDDMIGDGLQILKDKFGEGEEDDDLNILYRKANPRIEEVDYSLIVGKFPTK